MEESERRAIEHECERLAVAYTHYVDFGEAERIAELFADDGVWEAPGTRMSGQEELRKGFGARQRQSERRSRHVCTNFGLDRVTPDEAEGVVYLVLFRHDDEDHSKPAPLPGPAMVGAYRDRFRRTPDGWRFAHRVLEVTFARREDG